jgi:glycosyltransferase involved in cell wall biosynthesis
MSTASALPPATGAARVSVVMPVYNAARHLEAALRSALASSLVELEVIVVDDGSTDGSLEIARAIADPRVLVITQRASGGPSRPRNVGIARSRAPYVALLDADDLLKPDKLSAAVAALDAHPGAGLAFADFERIDDEGRVIERTTLAGYPVFQSLKARPAAAGWRVLPSEEFARGLLYENFIGTSGVILRRSALEHLGTPFDETLTYSEDRDLWFRLAHAGEALYSPRVGHSYRVTPGGLSLRPGARQAHSRIEVLRRERARWQERGALRQIDRLIAENLAAVAYDHRRCGRRFSSVATFLRAALTSPESRWMRAALGSLAAKSGSAS